MSAKPPKSLVHVEPGLLGYDAFGLLYDDAAVERVRELLDHDLGIAGGAVMNDGDSGDVGHGLGGYDVAFFQGTFVSSEKTEGSDDDTMEAHGQGVHRSEVTFDCFGRKAGPATVDTLQILVHHRRPCAKGIQRGSFLGLQFEEFNHVHRFA